MTSANMTEGNITRHLLRFLFPLLLGNAIQQMYTMADALLVGRGLGENALAAIGASHGIHFVIMGAVTGFAQGMSIVTAQYFGAQDTEGVRKNFAICIALALVVSAAVTIGSVVFVGRLLHMLRTPAAIYQEAYEYIIVILWGVPAMVAFNLFSNAMRAVGNSKSPFLFLTAASILNVVLDAVAIFGLGLGVRAAAVSTVIAQAFSALLCWRHIRKHIPVLWIQRKDWRLAGFDVRKHLGMGSAMGLQTAIIGLGQLAVSFTLNGMGSAAVVAITAAQKIDGVGIMPLHSLGGTLCTFVSQNFGARKMERVFCGVRRAVWLAVAYAIPMAVVNVLWGGDLAALFVRNDTETVHIAHTYLIVNGVPYVVIGLMYIFRSTVQGLGYGLAATASGFVELAMRVMATVFFSRWFGYAGLVAANPLAWMGSALLMGTAYWLIIQRMKPRKERATG